MIIMMTQSSNYMVNKEFPTSHNFDVMVGQRLRRWPNITPALGKYQWQRFTVSYLVMGNSHHTP